MFDAKRENYAFYFRILAVILLLAWYGIFLAQKIDLTTADLGRHLKNGELLLRGLFSGGGFDFLKTNFYSYTNPDFPVINHHWGAGIIFYLTHRLFGFSGLSLFYVGLILAAFLLFFDQARRWAGFKISAVLALFLIPLMAERVEVRPEVFSYFFAALFFWILCQYKRGSFSERWLFFLPVLEIFWANTHIYFFLGPLLIGIFLIEDLIFFNKEKVKKLSAVFVLTAAAVFLNPFGIKAALYPFGILKNYGYLIVENQSVFFLERLGIVNNPNFLLFKITLFLLVLSFILTLAFRFGKTNSNGVRRDFFIIHFLLAAVFGAMAWLAIRNFTLLGFFALPILAFNVKSVLFKKVDLGEEVAYAIFIISAIFIFIFGIANNSSRLNASAGNFGLGLAKGNDKAAEFFLRENIQGPILNNYDIGGYLIYYLFPLHRVFVDNRPEAYPASFFQETYVPLLDDEAVWKKRDERDEFNAIFFSHRDATPWGQKFLIARVDDPSWAPVFADQYAIIFLKRNDMNKEIIERYEIPKENFKVIKLK